MKRPWLLLPLLTGCVYATPRVHAPVRLAAANVTVDNVDAEEAEGVAHDALVMLRGADRAEVGAAANIDVNITVGDVIDFLTCESPCWPTQDGLARVYVIEGRLFGLIQDHATVWVNVVLHAPDGRTLVGHGVGEKNGSMYAPARRRALAVALDRALADAREW